ncbi:MAG: phage tail tape measure protein [Prevotella sp.]|nr:phage tail tape measure protein [Prevotella sp.]
MAHTEKYETVIRLNTEQAKDEIEKLSKKVDGLKKKRSLIDPLDVKALQEINKEIKKEEANLAAVEGKYQRIERTIKNMSAAGPKELRDTIRSINTLLNNGSVERGSTQWKYLTSAMKEANTELAKIRTETKASQSAFGKFFKFLNDSWGGIFVLVQSISGVTTTIRKSVDDFAQMEEEMADVRKYTGMTADQVRDLNEEFKKMDTRTSREQLNQLAGSAGRLGLQSKKDIQEFVEAADMIGVALGDDLGEGAVDSIGKLAMAFGEDEKKGLKGAMLSTGSALNELAQNSSAQAGYLVDFTARVAGFGKQLGLTQAQIMGFGTVMDENLLQDEMAATAFGNMLTKMQTDTAKFAKIAGKDVKEFSEMLREDANGAILTLADSLKKADPQTMMKMLDDMGLDGSRAVAVLATMADKIDDVRKHQERATEAYEKATSVQGEFNTMNTTVQAEIEKCKKRFHEMSIELGERLLPVVKYTITGASALTRGLSVLTGFVYDHWKAIVILSTEVALITTVYKAAEIRAWAWAKVELLIQTYHKAGAALLKLRTAAVLAYNAAVALLTGNVTRAAAAMRLMKMAALSNPYTALLTVVLTLGTAIWGLVAHFRSASKEAQENAKAVRQLKEEHDALKAVSDEANAAVAEEMTKFKQLRRTLEDNRKSYEERKKALNEIKNICPEYHGQLTTENRLINSNTSALDDYTSNLIKAARAQAAFNKMVKLQESSMGHEDTLQHRQGNRRYAQQQLKQLGASEGTTFKYADWNVGYAMYDEQGKFVKYVDAAQKKQIENYQQLIEYNNKRISQEQEILDRNQKQSEQMQKIVEEGKDATKKVGKTSPTITKYETDADRKKQEAEANKAETERKKKLKEQADAAKASYNEQLAEEMLAYRQGISTYSDYLEEKHNITQNYYDRLKAIYGEDSVEYRKQLLNREKDEDDYIKHQNKKSQQGFRMERIMRELELQKQFNDQNNKEMFQNEEALNEALFRSDRQYMLDKQSLYKEGSLEWEEAATEIKIMEEEHRLQLEQEWMRRLSQYREEMGQTDYDRLQEIELAGVESFYSSLMEQGMMTQQEYDAIIEHIKRKYAELKGEQKANSDVQTKAASGLETAKKNAGVKDYGAGDNAATGVASIANAVQNQQLINEQLKQLYGEDYENNREYQEAKRQLDMETMQQIVAGAQAAYSTIGTLMSAASSYAQACSDLEVARISANYDKQIEAAGRNSKKKEKLEKERDKKIAEAKTKANKKAMVMEIAQAIAQTAMGAISAYSSTMAGAPYPANLVLAPISAGIALAAGALQVATIKKQHQAEEAGYYEGGFTGGRRYRKEAGVVHEGEFVANHQAVNNPNVLPFLNFLDQAQRNNTVGSLTAQDVSRSMGAGGTTQMITPIVNVQTDNGELRDTMEKVCETQDRLATQLEQGIGVDFPMDSFDQSYKHYKKIKER